MEIRSARKKDFNELLEIIMKNVEHHLRLEKSNEEANKSEWESPKNIKKYHSEELKEIFKEPKTKIFVAIVERKIVGFIQISFLEKNAYVKSKRGEIDDLFVLKNYRKQRIGKKLVKKGLSVFKSKGTKVVLLNVNSNNEPAIKFYRKFDFKTSLNRLSLKLN